MSRLDRYGEPIEDADPEDGHRCARGWLDRNGDHPQPCPACRPWLVERPPRKPTPEELAAWRERLVRTS